MDDAIIPKQGELPHDILPVDGKEEKTFAQAALWYLRYMGIVKHGIPKHVCPICGEELHFHFCEVYGDPYMDYIMVRCLKCKISSDSCYYPRYNISPIELANGAMQRAIDEFEKRVKVKR